jgi:hypothetical protein
VQSFAITPGPGQNQPVTEDEAMQPGAGWSPEKIVTGFRTASAVVGGLQVAREYLTPEFSRSWLPGWTATVFSSAPAVEPKLTVISKKTATVTIGGKVQAKVSTSGNYAVPSASLRGAQPYVFHLTKNSAGQWRIDFPTPTDLPLLLASDEFSHDYQQRNLYFFDPQHKYLVPDPVYVPLQDTAADLMHGLAADLNTPPKKDWLNGATATAFPSGTKVSDVTLDGGTATVNLTGAKIGKANQFTMKQVSAQLLLTLTGSGQGGPAVQSIEVVVNGRPWIPKPSQENPVQNTRCCSWFTPPRPAKTAMFYYLDRAGNLMDQVGPTGSPVLIQQNIGKGYSQIAISSGLNGPYIAALRYIDRALLIGPVGGRLAQRGAPLEFSSMSWDPNGDLWATPQVGNQIVRLRGDASPGSPGFQPVAFTVKDSAGGIMNATFTAIRVAPDGVRVALIVGGAAPALYFGAIDSATATIVLSPFSVPVPQIFTAVTWYGPDNVITLGPGQALTEYPVNGGTSTSISPPPGISSITASANFPLIAGAAKGGLYVGSILTGDWSSINLGKDKLISPPVYPG